MKVLWIISLIYCLIWAPILAEINPILWLIIDFVIVIWASIYLLLIKIKKKKLSDNSIIFPIICLWLIFTWISLVKVKDNINIPQFTDGFMYYLPKILITIWMIPTFIYAFFYALIVILLIFKSRWLDNLEKIKGKYIDYFWMSLFIWWWIAIIWLILWSIFTPFD